MKIKKSIKASKKLNRKPITASRNVEVLSFNELSEEQQEAAVQLASTNSRLADVVYDSFNDVIMDQYYYDVDELVAEYESKLGCDIDAKKLYWQSNSQGPYPEWDLSKVFGNIYLDGVGNIFDGVLSFWGGNTDVKEDAEITLDDEDETYLGSLEISELSEYGVSEDAISFIEDKLNTAQEFIDKVWAYVHDVCTSYPDEDYVYDLFSANEYEFTIDDDGKVKFFGF